VRLMFKYLIWAAVLLLLGGCAPKRTITWPPGRETIPNDQLPPRAQQQPPNPATEPQPARPNPRAQAALTFSEQGRTYLDSGNPDAAIRALERAVNLYPQNGVNYYYLAEAWLMKKNTVQAAAYNHLADIYFKDDPEWLSRTESQLARIKAAGMPTDDSSVNQQSGAAGLPVNPSQ